MALDQSIKNGVVYVNGTASDIETARLASALIIGRLYVDLTNNKQGRATATNVIRWEVLQSDIDSAVLVEKNRAEAAEQQLTTDLAAEVTRATGVESTLTSSLAAEVTARQTGDATNATAIAAEATARASADTALGGRIDTEATTRAAAITAEATARAAAITAEANARIAQDDILIQQDINLSTRIGDEELARQVGDQDLQAQIDAMDTAYKAADASNLTTVNTSIANLAAALRDERVTDFVGVDYTASQSMTVASLLGSSPLEGIHLFKFNSTDINNTATVTGLPGGAANLSITYNDIVRVVVDGGVATSVSLVDDALKTKFDSVDSSISDLQAATTATAIRAHISATGFVKFVNGVITSALSVQSGNDIILGTDGNPYLSVQGTSIRYTVDGNLVDATVSNTITDIYAQLADVSANLVQADNGLSIEAGKVGLGGELRKDAVITGAHAVDMSAINVVKLPYATFECFNSAYNAITGAFTRTTVEGTGKVEMWFDAQGDPKFTYVPN